MAGNSSIPIISSCLESKMAPSSQQRASSRHDASARKNLLPDGFDVDTLLSELTVEEKAALLAGIPAPNSTPHFKL